MVAAVMLSSVFSRKHSRLFVFRGHLVHERAHVILAQKNVRIEELSATVARLADLEREGLRDRVALIEGFLHAEMAKSEKILALIPPKKEGFFARLFGKRD